MPSLRKRLKSAGRASLHSLSDPLGPLAPSLPSVNKSVHTYQSSPSLKTGLGAVSAVSSYLPAGGAVGRASKLSRGLGFTRSASELPLINASPTTRALSSAKRAISSARSSLPSSQAVTSGAGQSARYVARSRLGRGLALGLGASLAFKSTSSSSSSSSSSSTPLTSAQGLAAVGQVNEKYGAPGVSALKEGLKATRARLVGTGDTPRTEGRGQIRSIGNPSPDRSSILHEEVKKAFARSGSLRQNRSLRGGAI